MQTSAQRRTEMKAMKVSKNVQIQWNSKAKKTIEDMVVSTIERRNGKKVKVLVRYKQAKRQAVR